jgi:hypothetical protein
MISAVNLSPSRPGTAGQRAVVLVATAIAVLSARPFAGGWNDGSRLATVECLVDHHTLAIDRSIFVHVPPRDPSTVSAPYPEDDAGLLQNGTGDKLLIGDHYYSDKSPVPALLMAGVYQGLQWSFGLRARERPDLFCYWMTVLSSGLAYVVAIWCIHRLGGLAKLSPLLQWALPASLGLSTVALPYVRHVNNHILLLGIVAPLMLELVRLADEVAARRVGVLRLLGLGTLAGLGYATDLGVGPVLLLGTLLLIAFRCQRVSAVALFSVAVLPWLALHHAVNYAVGGTWKPANAVPEYFQWPGCSFNAGNMTGTWNHESLGQFLTYAIGLLVGKKGFFGHDLALFLAVPAIVVLLRQRVAEVPELLFTGGLCGGAWLAYALTSNNSSGLCCSVRWFVPLLAPGYYVLAVFLQRYAHLQWIFLVLSGWGAVLGAAMWWEGPWMKHMIPLYWPLQGAALLSLVLCWLRRRSSGATLRRPQSAAPGHRVSAA